jgi:hypothetical protein
MVRVNVSALGSLHKMDLDYVSRRPAHEEFNYS